MSIQFDNQSIDSLLSQCKGKEDIFGEDGLIKQLIKSVVQRALDAEMTEHLGYSKHAPEGKNTGNSRNGYSKKTDPVLEIRTPFYATDPTFSNSAGII